VSRLAPKALATFAATALLVLGATLMPVNAGARPTPRPSKACSSHSIEHFHGVTAHLPDGTKCLDPGETCSHGRGFASAYREYGFVCRGRLEEI
jgi:hypothetical protein